MIHFKTIISVVVLIAAVQMSAGLRSARVRRQAEENGTIGIMPISATLDETSGNGSEIIMTAMPVDAAIDNTTDPIILQSAVPAAAEDNSTLVGITAIEDNSTLVDITAAEDNLTTTAIEDDGTVISNETMWASASGGSSGSATSTATSTATAAFIKRVKSAYCSPTEISQTDADFRALIIKALELDEATAADLTLKQLKIRYIIYLIDSDSLLGECFADLRDKLANLDE